MTKDLVNFLRFPPSDDHLRLMVLLAEFCGVATLTLTEQAVEIAQRVETAVVAYLRYRLTGVNQTTGSIAQTDVDNILGEVLAGVMFEESAEGRWRHAHQTAQHIKTEIIDIVFADVMLDLQDAARLVINLNLGIRRGRQLAGIGELRQLV